eukprot:SAG31_NODE_605_length_13628_cov_24.848030_1_plen_177_part_00
MRRHRPTSHRHCGIQQRRLRHDGRSCSGKGCYFLIFVQLFEKYGTLIERNAALIEKVSPCSDLQLARDEAVFVARQGWRCTVALRYSVKRWLQGTGACLIALGLLQCGLTCPSIQSSWQTRMCMDSVDASQSYDCYFVCLGPLCTDVCWPGSYPKQRWDSQRFTPLCCGPRWFSTS